MKKIILLLIALSPILATAQITPEAMIKGCPDLPKLEELVAYADNFGDGRENNVSIFLEKLREYIAKCRASADLAEAAASEKTRKAYDKEIRKETGKSIEQWQAMTETQREIEGSKLANKKLREMGINTDISKMKNMSETEKNAAGQQMTAQMLGVSVSDLQKMSKMSEEEIMAYMTSGAGQNMLNKMSEHLTQGALVANTVDSEEKLNRIKEIQQEIMKYQNKLLHEQEEWSNKSQAVHNTADEIWWKKYRPTVVSLETQWEEDLKKVMKIGDEDIDKRYSTAIKGQYIKFYKETIPLWIAHIKSLMEYYRQSIPFVRKYDDLNREFVRLTGTEASITFAEGIETVMSCGFSYLETAGSIADFPRPGPGKTNDGKE